MKDDTRNLIIIAGLGIGAYFLYTTFAKPVTQTIEAATTSIVKPPSGYPDVFPSPIEALIPILSTPKVITLFTTPLGGTKTKTPTILDYLFPVVAAFDLPRLLGR